MIIDRDYVVPENPKNEGKIQQFLFSKQKMFTEFSFLRSEEFIQDSLALVFPIQTIDQLTQSIRFWVKHSRVVGDNNIDVGGPFWKAAFLHMVNQFIQCCNGCVRFILRDASNLSVLGDLMRQMLLATRKLECVNQSKMREYVHLILYKSEDFYHHCKYKIFDTFLAFALVSASNPHEIIEAIDAQDFQIFDAGDTEKYIDKQSVIFLVQRYWTQDSPNVSQKLAKYNVKEMPQETDFFSKLAFDKNYRKIVALCLVLNWKRLADDPSNVTFRTIMDLNSYYLLTSQIKTASKDELNPLMERVHLYLSLSFETFATSEKDFTLFIKCLSDSVWEHISHTSDYIAHSEFLTFSFQYVKYLGQLNDYYLHRLKNVDKVTEYILAHERNTVYYISWLHHCRDCLLHALHNNVGSSSEIFNALRQLEQIQIEILECYLSDDIPYPLRTIWFMTSIVHGQDKIKHYLNTKLLDQALGRIPLPTNRGRQLTYIDLYHISTVLQMQALYDNEDETHKYTTTVLHHLYEDGGWAQLMKHYEHLGYDAVYGHFVCRFIKKLISDSSSDEFSKPIEEGLLNDYGAMVRRNGCSYPPTLIDLIGQLPQSTILSAISHLHLACYSINFKMRKGRGRKEILCEDYQPILDYQQEILKEKQVISSRLPKGILRSFFEHVLLFRYSSDCGFLQDELLMQGKPTKDTSFKKETVVSLLHTMGYFNIFKPMPRRTSPQSNELTFLKQVRKFLNDEAIECALKVMRSLTSDRPIDIQHPMLDAALVQTILGPNIPNGPLFKSFQPDSSVPKSDDYDEDLLLMLISKVGRRLGEVTLDQGTISELFSFVVQSLRKVTTPYLQAQIEGCDSENLLELMKKFDQMQPKMIKPKDFVIDQSLFAENWHRLFIIVRRYIEEGRKILEGQHYSTMFYFLLFAQLLGDTYEQARSITSRYHYLDTQTVGHEHYIKQSFNYNWIANVLHFKPLALAKWEGMEDNFDTLMVSYALEQDEQKSNELYDKIISVMKNIGEQTCYELLSRLAIIDDMGVIGHGPTIDLKNKLKLPRHKISDYQSTNLFQIITNWLETSLAREHTVNRQEITRYGQHFILVLFEYGRADLALKLYLAIKPYLNSHAISTINKMSYIRLDLNKYLENGSATLWITIIGEIIKNDKNRAHEIHQALKTHYENHRSMIEEKLIDSSQQILKVLFVIVAKFKTFINIEEIRTAIQQVVNRVQLLKERNVLIDLLAQCIIVYRATFQKPVGEVPEYVTMSVRYNKLQMENQISPIKPLLEVLNAKMLQALQLIVSQNSTSVMIQDTQQILQSKAIIKELPHFDALMNPEALAKAQQILAVDNVVPQSTVQVEAQVSQPLKNSQGFQNSFQNIENILQSKEPVELHDQLARPQASQFQEEKQLVSVPRVNEKKTIRNVHDEDDDWSDEDDNQVQQQPEATIEKVEQQHGLKEAQFQSATSSNTTPKTPPIELDKQKSNHDDDSDWSDDVDVKQEEKKEQKKEEAVVRVNVDDDGSVSDSDEENDPSIHNQSNSYVGDGELNESNQIIETFADQNVQAVLLLREHAQIEKLTETGQNDSSAIEGLLKGLSTAKRKALLKFSDEDFYNSLPVTITGEIGNFNTEVNELQTFLIDNLVEDTMMNSQGSGTDENDEGSGYGTEQSGDHDNDDDDNDEEEEDEEGSAINDEGSSESDISNSGSSVASVKHLHDHGLRSGSAIEIYQYTPRKPLNAVDQRICEMLTDIELGVKTKDYCSLQTCELSAEFGQQLLYIQPQIFELIIEDIEKCVPIPLELKEQDKELYQQQYAVYCHRLGEVLVHFYRLSPVHILTFLKSCHLLTTSNKDMSTMLVDFLIETNQRGPKSTMVLVETLLGLKTDMVNLVCNSFDAQFTFDRPLTDILVEQLSIIPKPLPLFQLIRKLTVSGKIELSEKAISQLINLTTTESWTERLHRQLLKLLKNIKGVQKTFLVAEIHSAYLPALQKLETTYVAYDTQFKGLTPIEIHKIINLNSLININSSGSDVRFRRFWSQFQCCIGTDIPFQLIEETSGFYGTVHKIFTMFVAWIQDQEFALGTEISALTEIVQPLKYLFRTLCYLQGTLIKQPLQQMPQTPPQFNQVFTNILHLTKLVRYYANLDTNYIGIYYKVFESLSSFIKVEELITVENILAHQWRTIQKTQEIMEYDESYEINLEILRGCEIDYIIHTLWMKDNVSLLISEWHTNFIEEQGADQGGLTQDLITTLMKSVNDERKGLFLHTHEHKRAYPNYLAQVIPDFKSLYVLIGALIAKSVMEGYILGFGLAKFVMRQLYGEHKMTLEDLQEYNAQLYSSFKWMHENSVQGLDLYHTVTEDRLGVQKHIDLIPDGSHIPVDDSNKDLYIQRLIEYHLIDRIKDQVNNLRRGFNLLFSNGTKQIVHWSRLLPIMEGLSFIDVNEMKKHVDYDGFAQNSPLKEWFWEILEHSDQEFLADFLYFVTCTDLFKCILASYRLPKAGFEELKITLQFSKHEGSLPIAHTCSNQLDIFDYQTKEEMQHKLYLAIRNSSGFGYA